MATKIRKVPLLTVIHKNLLSILKEVYKTSGDEPNAMIAATSDYMTAIYGEENINKDVVEIWVYKPKGIVISGVKVDDLRFGNLYSYVLSCSIHVPYSEWIYEEEYVSPKGTKYKWDKRNAVGEIEEDSSISTGPLTPPTSPGTTLVGPWDYEEKDKKRIQDLIRDHSGEEEKWAHIMAKKIGDKDKMLRRVHAAMTLKRSDIARVFKSYYDKMK